MNRMGNGNGNSNGLPFHANGGSRKNAFSSITNNARRISPGRLFILMGLCVVSLIAVTRWASGKESHIPFDHLERDGALTDREIVVRHILDSRKSHYSFDDFTEDGLVAPGNEHLRPATAILLGWKRLDGLKLVVNYLARYPYIKEIIIWNNNKDMTLTARDFDFDKSFGPLPELNIHNGKENMHDYSKYMSCALAKYDHCYFQDDDWLNTHMDALYTNFLTSPTLIHTNTMPMIHIEHKRWSFTNDEVRMHTGFAWLGTGSFLPREKASGLMSQASSGNLAKARLRVIDMYFSIWTNQYPYQLVNYLTPLDQKDGWSDATDHWSIVFRNMLDAADRLYSALLANPEVSEKDSFVREEERPYIAERHVRAPCANDRCLFMTSIDPFPNPNEVVFKGDLKDVKEQDDKFAALDFPSNEFWDKHNYVHAVDSDPNTCWNSYKPPKSGDSFGLRFVQPTNVKKLTITSSRDISLLEKHITVMVAGREAEDWYTCNHTSRFPYSHTMVLELDCPRAGPERGFFDVIKVQVDVDMERSLEVCGMEVDGMAV